MVKITLGTEGMACGMCETHINEAVRNAFQVNIKLHAIGIFIGIIVQKWIRYG